MYEADSICRASLRRCNSNPEFLDIFYDRFISSSQKVAEKFEHVDMEKQKQTLKRSLRMLIMSGRGDDTAVMFLRQVAERHSRRGLNIEPGMYAPWLESLIATVQQVDVDFSPEVEQAWREILGRGIEYMIAAY